LRRTSLSVSSSESETALRGRAPAGCHGGGCSDDGADSAGVLSLVMR